MFGKTFEVPSDPNSGVAVVIKDISVFSYCEHHMALMYDMKVDVAYVPRGRVLGLSKIAGTFGTRYCRDNFACGFIARCWR